MFSLLPPVIFQRCQEILSTGSLRVSSLSGGDINEARLLITENGERFFLKFNLSGQAEAMLRAEVHGLQLLRTPSALKIPDVIAVESTADGAFLLLEYLEETRPSAAEWRKLGHGLALIHQHTREQFGLDTDNFIGTLTQSNRPAPDFPTFYVRERLQPQAKMAADRGLLHDHHLRQLDKLYRQSTDLLPNEPPALIHGDLWSGNIFATPEGEAVLIDPAVAFAHRELDLGMSMLFGQFGKAFYQTYQEVYPLTPGFEERVELYQLYYLLVHVNLFGQGYLPTVERILNHYVR